MRLGDLDALKDATKKLYNETLDGIVKFGIEKVYNIIDNAPTIDPFERIGSICEENCGYRPQGDIRWTDKIFIKSSGDIVDFEGRVVGHINLEDMVVRNEQ